MKRNIWVVLAAGALLAGGLVASCGPTQAQLCSTDADCAAGERCDALTELCVVHEAGQDGGGEGGVDGGTEAPPPLSLTGRSLPQAEAGKPYAQLLTAAGGVTPYAWKLLDAGLGLGWLTLNATTGALGGTPEQQAPEASFQVSVSDSDGGSASAVFQLAVAPCATDCPDAGPTCTPNELCRPAQGDCDVAELCRQDGTCPPDVLEQVATVCRPNAGECDVPESCSGLSPSCPADKLAPSTSVCRSSAGTCDPEERCTGSDPGCPQDTFAPSGTVCRGVDGGCDVEEKCTGTTAFCPQDGFKTASSLCRPATDGGCDVPEYCPGDGPACPADKVATATTVCRAAPLACDKQETCDGTTKLCPADLVQPATYECAAQSCTNGVVTQAARCTGGQDKACPAASTLPCNGYQCSGSACRTSCTLDAHCLSTHYCQTSNTLCAPKKVDGQPCGANVECVSGACTQSWADGDNDGFGAGPGGFFCGTAAPAGRRLNNTDCCDTDGNARPNQTGFFTAARNGCGGFDYNCDGSQTLERTVGNACQTTGACGPQTATCAQGTGWAGAVPGCGVLWDWVTTCYVENACSTFCEDCTTCSPYSIGVTQGCR